MQEGCVSLMQMAKTSQAIGRLHEEGVLYISLLTDPTYGGVSASFAMLGDLLVSEPGSLIGFAGPKVIEQTIRQKLPEGFQTAEFLMDHGQLDLVEPRETLRVSIRKILELHATRRRAGGRAARDRGDGADHRSGRPRRSGTRGRSSSWRATSTGRTRSSTSATSSTTSRSSTATASTPRTRRSSAASRSSARRR